MSLTEIAKKEEPVKEIYRLIIEGEKESTNSREKSMNFLEEAFSMYEKLVREEGRKYCTNNCPDIPKRMNLLVDKLMNCSI